ncbi:MAG: sulfatase-like hydrolase/transferase [Acidimicrobiales bacterium]
MPDRRSVLFILADQLQAFALGCMGHPEIRTPNLDALAAGGALFRNAYVEFPVCTQYRGVLMTGRYGAETGITSFLQGPEPGTRCLADALNDHGLWTSYVGKWHLYEFYDMAVRREQRCGFTRFVGYQSHNDYLEGIRFWDEDEICREFVGGHRTRVTADIAIERLREIPAERDFGLFVSFLSPHYPLQPDPAFEAMYRGVEISLRDNVTSPEQVFTPTYSPASPQPIETDPNYHRYGTSLGLFWQQYAAMVTQLDHEVGRILRELRSLGRDEETLVIFTSDHGEMGGSHGAMNKGRWEEESTRVPMIVRAPGAPIAAAIDTPVAAGVDILPTVLDWLDAPAEPSASGSSIMAMVRSGANRPHHPVFSEMAGGNDWTMVRDGDWKFVAARGSGDAIALHNLAEDPFELDNRLADDPAVRIDLEARLDEWRSRVGLPAT